MIDEKKVLTDKQKEILKFFDMGYGMKKEGDDVFVFTNTDRKIKVDWENEIKPLHQMNLISKHSTMLEFVYFNLSELGKEAYK